MPGKKRSGLTLIEMVMTMVIVGILAGGSMLYIRQVIDLWNFVVFRSDSVGQARIAISRMSRDIRQVNNDTSVIFANATRLQFNDVNDQSITYYLSGNNTLMRNSDALASGINNLAFIYYNTSNQPVSTPMVNPQVTDIRRINIKFNVFSGGQKKAMETQVYLRNIGDGQ